MSGRSTRSERSTYTGAREIHLDRVQGLGQFLELEVVLGDGERIADGQREAERLMRGLGLSRLDLVPVAYVDLLNQAV